MLTILVVLIKIGSFTSDKEVRAYDSIVCLAKSGTSAWQSHTHDPHQVGMLLKAMFSGFYDLDERGIQHSLRRLLTAFPNLEHTSREDVVDRSRD